MTNERLLREFVRAKLIERMSGAEIAGSGSGYEKKLVADLEAVGIRTAGVAGFTAAADVTVITAWGKAYGIEAKISATADMGSAGMRYDPEKGKLSVSNRNSPIGAEVHKRLRTIHSDREFMDAIRAIYDAGFLQKSAPASDMVAWRESTGLPSQPGRSYSIPGSDLIARHYQAKGETAEYIQIKGKGLYVMDPAVDPLGLMDIGVKPLIAPISISVKVAQKGSSTPKPGKVSKLSMSAKAKIMTKGFKNSGIDLDNLSDLLVFKDALGYDESFEGNLMNSVIR